MTPIQCLDTKVGNEIDGVKIAKENLQVVIRDLCSDGWDQLTKKDPQFFTHIVSQIYSTIREEAKERDILLNANLEISSQ